MFSLDWMGQFFFLFFPYGVEILLGKLHGFHADKWAFDKSRSVFWSGQRAGLHWVITSSQRGVRGRKRSPAERGLRGAVEELWTRTTCRGAQAWSAPNISDQLCHCLSSPLSFLPSHERIGLPPHFPELRLAVGPYFFYFLGGCCHILATILYLSTEICRWCPSLDVAWWKHAKGIAHPQFLSLVSHLHVVAKPYAIFWGEKYPGDTLEEWGCQKKTQ